MVSTWPAVSRESAAWGEVERAAGRVLGAGLRRAGVLILSSTLVAASALVLGPQNRFGGGAPLGLPVCWDARVLAAFAVGYALTAKASATIAAALSPRRIADELGALEAMGIPSVRFACGTRLLGLLALLPFICIAAVGAVFFATYGAVVQQLGEVSPGGYSLVFWTYQQPPDPLLVAVHWLLAPAFFARGAC